MNPEASQSVETLSSAWYGDAILDAGMAKLADAVDLKVPGDLGFSENG